MTDTFSPVLHRIDQAVRWRAVHPAEDVPPPYEILTRYSKPPEALVAKSKRRLEKLVAAANVKKGRFPPFVLPSHKAHQHTNKKTITVPPKTQSRKRTRNEIKPLSGLDVNALLGGSTSQKPKRPKITPSNPIPEFKQALDASDSVDTIRDAAHQLSAIIETQISESFGDVAYNRALEELRVMREELIEMEEPACFNEIVRELKRKILAGELGGKRREMWALVRRERLGLVEKRVSAQSDVGEEEAREFLMGR